MVQCNLIADTSELQNRKWQYIKNRVTVRNFLYQIKATLPPSSPAPPAPPAYLFSSTTCPEQCTVYTPLPSLLIKDSILILHDSREKRTDHQWWWMSAGLEHFLQKVVSLYSIWQSREGHWGYGGTLIKN